LQLFVSPKILNLPLKSSRKKKKIIKRVLFLLSFSYHNLLTNRKGYYCLIFFSYKVEINDIQMADKESIPTLTRNKSVPPELSFEVGAENLRRSLQACASANPPFVTDHAKTKLQEFTFVVCGAPRTGKSTLINAIMNKELAPTKSGPSPVTLETKCYVLEGSCPEKIDEQTGEKLQETQEFRINIWDTKGITTWDQKISDIITEKNPMCLILCSSPGSFAKDEFIRPLINQCVNLKVFVALVCTNQWNDSDEKRTTVMQELHSLLEV
jgi:GTPase SAR1 family protein